MSEAPVSPALDSQVAAFLAGIPSDATPLRELPLDGVRKRIAAFQRLGGEGPELARIVDLKLPTPDGPITARLYDPQPGEPLPMLVYAHGGGWVAGDIETHDAVCRQLADRAIVRILAVDYRRPPESRFPAAHDDIAAAVAYASNHSTELGVLPGGLGVAGDSSGGLLAASAAVWARDAGIPFFLQLLIYPTLDLALEMPSVAEFGTGYSLGRDDLAWLIDAYFGDADRTSAEASPLYAKSLANVAPAFVITAEADPTRDGAEAYTRRLADAGVPVTLVRVAGMVHGFFGMGVLFERGDLAVSQAAEAVVTAAGRRYVNSSLQNAGVHN
jgi:acetyl esterase/lipase